MEAATKIIFDDDEDLDVQSAALQSYISSPEAHKVKLGAKAAIDFNCYTLANSIIESGESATFLTSEKNQQHKLTQNTATYCKRTRLIYAKNRQDILTHRKKRNTPTCNGSPHVWQRPNFRGTVNSKREKILYKTIVLFTKTPAKADNRIIIGEKGSDNFYRLKTKLKILNVTDPYTRVFKANIDVSDKNIETLKRWNTVKKRMGRKYH